GLDEVSQRVELGAQVGLVEIPAIDVRGRDRWRGRRRHRDLRLVLRFLRRHQAARRASNARIARSISPCRSAPTALAATLHALVIARALLRPCALMKR